MSLYTDCSDNTYHTNYHACNENKHSRKGKTKNKHNKTITEKKIVQFKVKNNLGLDIWLSAYDVHKAKANKKRNHKFLKNIRAKGYDYKQFAVNHFIPDYDENIVVLHSNEDFWESWDDWFDLNDSGNWASYSSPKSV